MEVQNRIDWIDVLRGIGIFYVTVGHLNPNYLIEKHIYSFHMFLFFFLSGYLYKKPDSYKNNLIKKFKSLILPFIFWDFIATFVEILINKDILLNLRKFFILDGKMCWNAPIWFLLVLFIVEIIYTFLDKHLIKNRYMNFTVIIALVIALLLGKNDIILKLGIVPMGYFWYFIGHSVNAHNIMNKCNNKHIFILLVSITFNIIFGVILNTRISVVHCEYGNFFYCILAGFSGIAMYYIVSYYLSTSSYQIISKFKKIFTYLGKNSMLIMCTQYFFFRFYNILLPFDIWHMRSSIKALLVSSFTIVCILFINFLINKTKFTKLKILIGMH